MIGLPIMLFMLIVALGQPYLGSWSERVGRRKAMLVGAVVATVGFTGTALAYNLYDLIAVALARARWATRWCSSPRRATCSTAPATQNRAQGFALFIGAIMVATVCGPSIGGILADNIGFRASFGVVGAACRSSRSSRSRACPRERGACPPRRPDARRRACARSWRSSLNRRFMTLTGLAAMPAKIILTGVCFYLVPLYIVSIGNTSAMAGRMLMVYAVMMVLIVPISARALGRDA